jgi:hypothetical protein
MLINLLLGISTMGLCLFLQLALVVAGLRWYMRQQRADSDPSLISSLVFLNGVMVVLVIGNLAQVGLWALLFQLLGEFDRFTASYYHSAVNFATLGYGDVVMSDRHKLLGPIQAINGVLMIGVSTAALMSALQHAVKRTIQARKE